MMPGEASSLIRPITGSNMARPAPPIRRVSTKVQADVAGLRQVLQQRRERLTAAPATRS
ncbi:hypothetical protein [Micromonospora humidisoli]|uniref:hypothetical protein n=1 Tax=Micromonospora sp. AKA109 TaxID=2733865 RepID=UPI0024919C2C|nr:hypothetical protein [Micromonospora sp. AKA109]